MNNTTTKTKQTIDVRKLVFTALLSAMAVVLMKFLAFKIPIMPGFISFDFSDVPAVLASLTMGPVSGVAVCLIKNLGGFLLAGSMTGGVGEVSNFILGCLLVIPAGLIANRTGHSIKHVVLACLAGAVSMALVGVATNYFIVYPLYTAVMPMEAIIGMYQAIWSGADSLIKCLVVFNLPFTFVKGLRHDLSKYSPTEFILGVKYFQGTRSPNEAERELNGYSLAWMHHKGRNRHHFEYWIDVDPVEKIYKPVKMPLRFLAEMFCDRVAASKIYRGEKYRDSDPLDYFLSRKPTRSIHPETSDMLEKLLRMLADQGEEAAFAYLRELVKAGKEY